MSAEFYELDRNIIGKNIDCPVYANVGDNKPKPGRVVSQHSASVSRQWWKRPSGVAAVCLGLLCLLLLAGIIGLFVYYRVCKYFTERDKLQTSYNNVTEERDQLQTRYKTLTEERDNLQSERDKLQSERESFLLVKVFGNSNYYVSMEQKNWEYAKLDCLKRGAQLVIINNQEEQEFLISLKIRTWIGLSDIETEGTWRWVDGTPLTTEYWGGKEPNNAGEGEDCAEIYQCNTDPVKKWNDISCTFQLNWICEKPID
ncbi:hepatic lectin isoform X1 [Esox lucius]|uniref:C-type lectin domain-containing protein n=1 Tax=Esox lucius TaxID=8010 RepID=A0A6Q2YS59_ESOLU|nr:hepatic lectin isoform X1 [Esox lucius]